MSARSVDGSFLALPLSALTEAALTRAVDLGCEHADIRVERIRTQTISLRDARPEASIDGEDLGLAVRVVHEGTWGFAAGVVLTAAEAVRLAEEAVAVAQVSAAINTDRVELAPSRSTPTPSSSPPTTSTPSTCRTPRRPAC
ncbi:PmbA/TldA family metallopeptidase [Blastococcus brunescens]|uniref:DNA gyrase modulator n=1 Tax=Blastococcus brunescens TaxID=1564165 RepID=A0ABZ1AY49_9ACTN|nr:DNA gyrase modulator [Blastococcus sp. BMG 8361]WRL63495.1 DNA gyrase modulator [Blastococcus sp. BMG 8361]